MKEINGILLIDKEEGITSYDVIRKIKKILRELDKKTKIGHAGTLDPFATGLLVVLLGKYTRLSDYIMDGKKTYTGTIKLGISTDTGDYTGKIIKKCEIDDFDINILKENTELFIGEIMQTPPKFSALKIDGKPMYKYAREGIEVSKKARAITVYDLIIGDDIPSFKATVSKGTYIRTLIEDYCNHFHMPSHLLSLRRIQSGSFNVDNAIKSSEIGVNNFFDNILSIDEIPLNYEIIDVSCDEEVKLRNGINIIVNSEDQSPVFIRSDGIFALGKIVDNKLSTICFLRN